MDAREPQEVDKGLEDLPQIPELPSEVLVALLSSLDVHDALEETSFSVEDSLDNLFPDGAPSVVPRRLCGNQHKHRGIAVSR